MSDAGGYISRGRLARLQTASGPWRSRRFRSRSSDPRGLFISMPRSAQSELHDGTSVGRRWRASGVAKRPHSLRRPAPILHRRMRSSPFIGREWRPPSARSPWCRAKRNWSERPAAGPVVSIVNGSFGSPTNSARHAFPTWTARGASAHVTGGQPCGARQRRSAAAVRRPPPRLQPSPQPTRPSHPPSRSRRWKVTRQTRAD